MRSASSMRGMSSTEAPPRFERCSSSSAVEYLKPPSKFSKALRGVALRHGELCLTYSCVNYMHIVRLPTVCESELACSQRAPQQQLSLERSITKPSWRRFLRNLADAVQAQQQTRLRPRAVNSLRVSGRAILALAEWKTCRMPEHNEQRE
jgi:hypothetical protein